MNCEVMLSFHLCELLAMGPGCKNKLEAPSGIKCGRHGLLDLPIFVHSAQRTYGLYIWASSSR
jgi:hypothetical protein